MGATNSTKDTVAAVYINITSTVAVHVTKEDDGTEIISSRLRKLCLVVNNVFLGSLLGILGIVANIVNIIVFSRKGGSHSINISLTALAVGDIGALLTLLWFNVCVNPWFQESAIPFQPQEIQTLTGGFPHVYFTRVTGWIVAFVTVDRCVGILAPLKARTIITAKLARYFNIGLFLVMIPPVIPIYCTTYFDWKLSGTDRNETLLGVFYTENAQEIQSVTFSVTNSIMAAAFITVIVCTVVIISELRKRSKWRKTIQAQNTCQRKPHSIVMTTKDARLIKMIVILSFSSLPIVCFTTARTLEPELNIVGRYANLNWILASFMFLLETVYSSINIVIYHRMSSVYRAEFSHLFSTRRKHFR